MTKLSIIKKNGLIALVSGIFLVGCGKRDGGSEGQSFNIQNKGSDTMLQLAQAWSELYAKEFPDVA